MTTIIAIISFIFISIGAEFLIDYLNDKTNGKLAKTFYILSATLISIAIFYGYFANLKEMHIILAITLGVFLFFTYGAFFFAYLQMRKSKFTE